MQVSMNQLQVFLSDNQGQNLRKIIWKQARTIVPRAALLLCAFCGLELAASAQLIPSADGLTVYDAHLQARWLANANLAGTADGASLATTAGITTITPGGSMNYATALAWVGALNRVGLNGTVGYLGHTTWTLPTTPTLPATDPSCTSFNGSGGGSFGYGCTGSDFGSLFNLNTSLGLQYPNTAVKIPDTAFGPFHNFQPYLYWTTTPTPNPNDGFSTFSFNTGWGGANVDVHYIYALPMIKGKVLMENKLPVTYSPAGLGTLQVSSDGQLVYDPETKLTWLADANLAKSQAFGAQCANYEPPSKSTFFPPGIPCIAADGSMSNTTANNWLTGMNTAAWLGHSDWMLPDNAGGCNGFSCQSSELGELFYNQFGLSRGTPVVAAPLVKVGPFNHVQPYLYWSCSAPYTNPPCQTPPPNTNFEYSFSFGNGFEGTDLVANDLYVTVYFPQTPAQALIEAIEKALGTNPELNAFLEQANNIISAPNVHAKAGMLGAFTHHVDAQRGKALSGPQADELIALAQLI
jgi:hypothetical protein